MNIREYIVEEAIKEQRKRMERAKDIKVPTYFLSIEERELEELESGKISFFGETILLEEEVLSIEEGETKSGKFYIKFNGDIMFFPKGVKGWTIISI